MLIVWLIELLLCAAYAALYGVFCFKRKNIRGGIGSFFLILPMLFGVYCLVALTLPNA